MLYLESKPSYPLAGCIRSIWYCKTPEPACEPERVLPNGCAQIVISLATDALTNCDWSAEHPAQLVYKPSPPSVLVGARARYDIICRSDMAELVGIIFRPGGLAPLLKERADRFFDRSVSLGELWNASSLRDRLREEKTPAEKLAVLDAALVERLKGRCAGRRILVQGALAGLRNCSVRETAQSLGVSERRLGQVFSEDVGLSPKLWSRVHRFQRAVKALHSGDETRSDQLALACGYYDQSHFSNDFRSFSGIDPTTYSNRRGLWANHISFV